MSSDLIPLTGNLAIKANIQGTLIYLAMLIYILAIFLHLCRFGQAGRRAYFTGFIMALAAVIYRWLLVAHIPLQNLFEVFLVLGACGWPLSCFSRRYLAVNGQAGDILLSIVFLFPAGLVFSDAPGQLPPALQSWLFGPHVLAYMLAYFIMAKAALQGVLCLMPQTRPACELAADPELAAYRLISLGFPLLTLGLILGSIWGKLAWGDYWNWDPKELWSLATWLVYLLYFHWRSSFGRKHRRINALLTVLGFIFIIITLLWVNLARIFTGLHSSYTN